MAGLPRAQPSKRTSMRPPPRPAASKPSLTGRAPSPADSRSSSMTPIPMSPSVPRSAGVKRKDRDFDEDASEETNIHVVVRCRGRSDREVRENSGVVVSTTGVKGKNVELSMGPSALSNKTYHFDKVFSPAADQAIIFDDVVMPILGEMISGYNCTVFAYGQTGTGKTYTMSGDMTDTLGILSDAAGIIPRVLHSLFRKLEADEAESSVKCSFIELYNEELRDLLSADDHAKLKIFDDANKKGHNATVVQGMEESHIKSASEGIKLLQDGSHRRQVAATKCNDLSSRSHTVFTITTYIKRTADTGEDFICSGKLNLVDLAGSENIQRSGAENKRAAEAGLINKSLLTLGRVINALVDKNSHIPYRESKLTRLLQDSLGGRTKTCIIATVSPAKSNLEETISTLDYAFRAKNIRNKPQINSMVSKKTLLKEFTAEIEKLKSELIATRQRNGVYLTNETYEQMTVESESRRILSEEQKARIETMEVNLRNKVQELFSLTSNFNLLKKDNEATRTSLDRTQDVLDKTEIVLRNTQRSLAHESKLREAHQRTETKLYDLSSGMMSTLDSTVNDIDGLNSKLRRRSDLHAMNRKNWDASTSRIIQVTQMVDEKVQAFQIEQSDKIAQLSTWVDAFTSSEVEKLQASQVFLTTKADNLERSGKEVHEQTANARDEMNTVLEEIKVLREEVKQKVAEGLNGLSAAAAQISGEVIAELGEFHAQLHNSYSSLGKDFKTMFDAIVKHLDEQKTEAEDLRRQVQAANQKVVESNQTAAAQLGTTLQEEREFSNRDRQNLFDQVKALIEDSARAQDGRMSSRIESSQLCLNHTSTDLKNADTRYGQGMDAWTLKERELVDQVMESRDNLKSRMKKDWNAVNERNTSIQKSTKAVHEETVRIVDAQMKGMAAQMEALDEFVARARLQNDQHHDTHAKYLNGLIGDVQQSYVSIGDELTSKNDRLDSFSAETRRRTQDLESSMSPLENAVRQPLSDLRSQIQAAPITDYTPTGETPQKKDYEYPTTLPRTGPAEEIISEVKKFDGGWEGISPTRSADKIASSPSKLPSPNKGKVYNDLSSDEGSHDNARFRSSTADIVKLQEEGSNGVKLSRERLHGLREVDINVAARPATTDLTSEVFSRSVGANTAPSLKRHATADSKLPQKLIKTRSTKMEGSGRQNNPLAHSVGSGRRLRNSPQDL